MEYFNSTKFEMSRYVSKNSHELARQKPDKQPTFALCGSETSSALFIKE
jgi:hypothetical protein